MIWDQIRISDPPFSSSGLRRSGCRGCRPTIQDGRRRVLPQGGRFGGFGPVLARKGAQTGEKGRKWAQNGQNTSILDRFHGKNGQNGPESGKKRAEKSFFGSKSSENGSESVSKEEIRCPVCENPLIPAIIGVPVVGWIYDRANMCVLMCRECSLYWDYTTLSMFRLRGEA